MLFCVFFFSSVIDNGTIAIVLKPHLYVLWLSDTTAQNFEKKETKTNINNQYRSRHSANTVYHTSSTKHTLFACQTETVQKKRIEENKHTHNVKLTNCSLLHRAWLNHMLRSEIRQKR